MPPVMRTLAPPPSSIIDHVTLAPNAGSYRGDLPRVDLSPLGKDTFFRVKHHKRWVYFAVQSGELFIGAAMVDLGYASSCFYFVFDRAQGRMLLDRSLLGPSFLVKVNDLPGEGCAASAHHPLLRTKVSFSRPVGGGEGRAEIRSPELTLDVRLGTSGLPPAIGAVASIKGPPRGMMNATQKVALMPVSGELVIHGERRSLDGGLAGYDYTSGYLDRRTAWKWAFLLGQAKSGEKVAMNLVQGFVGEPECALWIDGELFPAAEGRFDFDASRPLEPWKVKTADGGVNLRFEPGAVHEERKDLVLVASRFIQPVGSFSGTIQIEGREPLELDRVLGVVEDQDVLW